jgi:hypothetical protein
MLDLKEVLLYVTAATAVISLVTTIWTILSSGSRQNAVRIDAHARRIEAVEARLQGVEQTVRAMPAKDDVHDLRLALADMKGELRAMHVAMTGTREIMGRLEAVVTRHEEHLLEGRG